MNICGHTKFYAVLGHPIGHTLSPAMHNASFQALGLDAAYLAFDLDPARLLSVLPAMRDMGFGGVNLTVPLKEVAFRGMENLDDSARLLGAVNTVEFTATGLRGHNTDGMGFERAVREAFAKPLAGLAVFVLGTGGAGRAVALTCAARGAARIACSDLDMERTARVAAEISRAFPGVEVRTVPAGRGAWREAALGAEMVVQATPVGMKPEDKPLMDSDCFRDGQMVYDLVYMFPETAFMKAAAKAGARTSNGLGMLLHQGAQAFTIWTGREADVQAMRSALECAVYGERRQGAK